MLSKQLNRFSQKAWIGPKRYVLYIRLSPGYKCFVERYCLRLLRTEIRIQKKELVQKAQSTWKSEGYAKDKKKIDIRYQYIQMSPTASPLYV